MNELFTIAGVSTDPDDYSVTPRTGISDGNGTTIEACGHESGVPPWGYICLLLRKPCIGPADCVNDYKPLHRKPPPTYFPE